MRDVNTIGIMFARPDNGEFPTVADMRGTSWMNAYLVDTEPFSEWLVIAYDPHTVTYYDDDQEAVDETNWDAIVSSVPNYDELPTVSSDYLYAPGGACWQTGGISDAVSRGVALLKAGQTFLIIAPPVWEVFDTVYGNIVYRTAHESLARDIAWLSRWTDYRSDGADLLETMRDYSRALSEYPLLDEDEYSEREYNAWQEYAPNAWRDELRNGGGLDETMLDKLDEIEPGDMLSILSEGLHHYAGFSGEYGPDFLDILADMLDKRDPRVCELLDYCRSGGGLHEPGTRCAILTCATNLARGQGCLLPL